MDKFENDANASCDGTGKCGMCKPDNYIYYIEYSGYAHQKKVISKRTGTVALIN